MSGAAAAVTGGAGEQGQAGTDASVAGDTAAAAGAGGGNVSGAGGSGGSAETGAICVVRGTVCNTQWDCKTGERCIERACQPGKPDGAACAKAEECGLWGDCDQNAGCIATRVVKEGDPCLDDANGYLDCVLEPDLLCNTWGFPRECRKVSTLSSQSCPCAWGLYCDLNYDTCAVRHGEGAPCDYLAPDSCEDGLSCRHDGATDKYTCLPPGHQGDYCDPVDHLQDQPDAHYWFSAWRFPPQCGPNLFCDDASAPDDLEILGRCEPMFQKPVVACNADQDCASGQRCREFFKGFGKSCGELTQGGGWCSADQRFPCDDGLTCVFLQPRVDDFDHAVCVRPVELGGACDKNSLCAEDGACVGP